MQPILQTNMKSLVGVAGKVAVGNALALQMWDLSSDPQDTHTAKQ